MDMLRLLSGDATPLHGVAGKGAADLMRDLIDSGELMRMPRQIWQHAAASCGRARRAGLHQGIAATD